MATAAAAAAATKKLVQVRDTLGQVLTVDDRTMKIAWTTRSGPNTAWIMTPADTNSFRLACISKPTVFLADSGSGIHAQQFTGGVKPQPLTLVPASRGSKLLNFANAQGQPLPFKGATAPLAFEIERVASQECHDAAADEPATSPALAIALGVLVTVIAIAMIGMLIYTSSPQTGSAPAEAQQQLAHETTASATIAHPSLPSENLFF